MKITTPVATLGIRGTTGVIDVPGTRWYRRSWWRCRRAED